jgi:hypothetical protein
MPLICRPQNVQDDELELGIPPSAEGRDKYIARFHLLLAAEILIVVNL